MKHFRVLQYETVDDLAKAVEHALNDSWELAGQMFTADRGFDLGDCYNQPIIKTTPDRPGRWDECANSNCRKSHTQGSNYCDEHKPAFAEG